MSGFYRHIDMMQHEHIINGKSIYKLECIVTGQFYFGQTKDMAARMYAHFMSISDHITCPTTTKSQYVHEAFAITIKEIHEKDKRKKLFKVIKENLKVSVLAFCAEKGIADIVESEYIRENIENPMCLNVKP